MMNYGLSRAPNRTTSHQSAPERTTKSPDLPFQMPVSTSQIDLASVCWRKWWFRYVAKVREAPKQFFAIGTALHSVSERWHDRAVQGYPPEDLDAYLYPEGWDTDLLPDQAEWIQKACTMAIETGLWWHEPGLEIEHPLMFAVGRDLVDANGLPLRVATTLVPDKKDPDRMHINSAGRWLDSDTELTPGWNTLPPLVGFIDLYHRLRRPAAMINDHKTSASRRWAKKAEDLVENTQVLTYAAVPMIEFDMPEVDVRHNIYLKKDPKAPKMVYAIENTVTRRMVADRWQSIIGIVKMMEQLRLSVLMTGSRSDPARADRWQEVTGADATAKGMKESCEAFGGCPYKDICFGYRNAEQGVATLDKEFKQGVQGVPAQSKSMTKAVSFGLNMPHTQKETSMPFPTTATTPAALVGKDVFILDPVDAKIQYKARVMSLNADENFASIAVWPMNDDEPVFATIPEDYIIEVPTESLLSIPNPLAVISNYAEELKKAGVNAPEWESATTETTAKATKEIEDKKPDGAFGLNGQAAAEPAEKPSLTTEQVDVKVGDVREVSDVEIGTKEQIAFWKALAGKQALVTNIAGDGLISVHIDHHAHEGIAPARVSALIHRPDNGDAALNNFNLTMEKVAGLVGKVAAVSVFIPSGETSVYRNKIVSFNYIGIELEGIEELVKWERVAAVEDADKVARPGDTKDATRVEKNASDEAATVDSIIAELLALFDSKAPKVGDGKETFGKKEFRPAYEMMALLQAKLEEGGTVSDAGDGDGDGTFYTDDDLEKRYLAAVDQGYAAACDTIIRDIEERKKS